jgi:hypothetical protein
MSMQRGLLGAYRLLLGFYPPAFRKRFAPEMLELAEAAELAEWPLIFGDTSVAIVRCWLAGSRSTVVLAEPNTYISLGESPLTALRLFQGIALSLVIVLGAYYVSSLSPAFPQCKEISTELVLAPSARNSPPNLSAKQSRLKIRHAEAHPGNVGR